MCTENTSKKEQRSVQYDWRYDEHNHTKICIYDTDKVARADCERNIRNGVSGDTAVCFHRRGHGSDYVVVSKLSGGLKTKWWSQNFA